MENTKYPKGVKLNFLSDGKNEDLIPNMDITLHTEIVEASHLKI